VDVTTLAQRLDLEDVPLERPEPKVGRVAPRLLVAPIATAGSEYLIPKPPPNGYTETNGVDVCATARCPPDGLNATARPFPVGGIAGADSLSPKRPSNSYTETYGVAECATARKRPSGDHATPLAVPSGTDDGSAAFAPNPVVGSQAYTST
jgi:hypothetical protein